MGNKPVVPENPSPSPAARPPRSKRSTLGSKGKAEHEISNPVLNPPITRTHKPYIELGDYQEDVGDLYIAKHNFNTDIPGQLSMKKGEKIKVTRFSDTQEWSESISVLGDVGWVPASYIAKVDSLEKHSWFHGNITRAEAELSLGSGINGSFLLRESESKPGQFSISLCYDGRFYHYIIHTQSQPRHMYFVTSESKFETLSELVFHHSKHPDGLVTVLHYPAPNSQPKRLFDEAMKHGHVLINIVNMLVFGPAGTGKTNLKRLLTDKPPPLQRDSTPCMEKPVRIRPVSNSKFKSTGRGWVEMSQSKLLNLLAQIIANLPRESTDRSTASRVAESLKKMTIADSNDPVSASISSPSSNDSDDTPRILNKAIDEVIASVVSDVGKELKLATQGTAQLSSSDQQEGELFDSNWVYVSDCGGQPQFHDISPLFTKHISVALVVLRLIDELSSFPSDEYYTDGQLVGSPNASHMTLGETLQSLIRSIESHTSQDKKPKIIFVGTFLDQLQSSDTLIKRNKEILDMLPPNIKKLLVYDDPGLNNLIFGLNAISREDDSLATANRIRIAVERSVPLQVKVPVWWSFLDSLLQSLSASLKRGVLSKQECLQLANRFSYVLKDLEAALIFFDEVCIAHYYPSILPNTVFVDAQIPLDKITELSQHAISLRTAEVKSRCTLSTGVTEARWERFRDEGIITLEFLRLFKKHYVEDIFSPEDMLLIMKNLLVIAPIPLVESPTHQTEFFMPSLLKSIAPVELDKIRSSFTISPLAVYFRSGCIRSGVFCCLVVDVIKSLGWEVLLPSGKPIFFAKNCIQLRIPKHPCTVTLIDSFSYIEVYIDVPFPLRKELCPTIRNKVLNSLKYSCNVLHYDDDTPETAIFCPCKKSTGSIHRLHLADVSERKDYWICSLQARVWGELSEEDRIWLDNGDASCESVTGDMCTLSEEQQQSGNLQSSVMKDVCKKTGVTDQQLDQEIPNSDIIFVSEKFQATPNLLDRLNLTPADLGDVTDVTIRYGNQAGVAHALRVWQRVNPSRATFRALVEIAIGLRRGDTATDICRFIVENSSGTDRK